VSYEFLTSAAAVQEPHSPISAVLRLVSCNEELKQLVFDSNLGLVPGRTNDFPHTMTEYHPPSTLSSGFIYCQPETLQHFTEFAVYKMLLIIHE